MLMVTLLLAEDLCHILVDHIESFPGLMSIADLNSICEVVDFRRIPFLCIAALSLDRALVDLHVDCSLSFPEVSLEHIIQLSFLA